jgi:hypothetical protein
MHADAFKALVLWKTRSVENSENSGTITFSEAEVKFLEKFNLNKHCMKNYVRTISGKFPGLGAQAESIRVAQAENSTRISKYFKNLENRGLLQIWRETDSAWYTGHISGIRGRHEPSITILLLGAPFPQGIALDLNNPENLKKIAPVVNGVVTLVPRQGPFASNPEFGGLVELEFEDTYFEATGSSRPCGVAETS